jgi:hypothetical protein
MVSRIVKTCAIAAVCSFALGFFGSFVWIVFQAARVHSGDPGIGAVAGGISFSLFWAVIAAMLAIFAMLVGYFWTRFRSPR